MSRFRVGQRVRIVRAMIPKNQGVVTVIVETRVEVDCPTFGLHLGYRLALRDEKGTNYVAHYSQIEPIDDDDTRALGAELLRRWTGEGVAA